MKLYSPRTKKRAKAILDGVIQISENEQLVHNVYLSNEPEKPELAKNICGGYQACLVGSIAVAADPIPEKGVKTALNTIDVLRQASYTPENDPIYSSFNRQISEAQRTLSRRPALRLAFAALNAEASDRLKRKRKTTRVRRALADEIPCEGYFEGYLSEYSKKATHKEIVSLVNAAKARI